MKIIWKLYVLFIFEWLLQAWVIANNKLFKYSISNGNSYESPMKNLLNSFKRAIMSVFSIVIAVVVVVLKKLFYKKYF